MTRSILIATVLIALFPTRSSAQYDGWQHRGSLTILTTPDGANLPAGTVVEDFPLLVRLNKEWFNFAQAKAGGDDIRFADESGRALPYQVDEWDASKGTAKIWVRIPKIVGNARQEIKLFWGKPDAQSESQGAAVFNESNGYLGVWHMNGPVTDDTGKTEAKDTGTSPAAGMIGSARHFSQGKGINLGESIAGYPTGSSPHTSEAWFRPELPNAIVMAWGNEAGQGKVTMRYASPPHVNMECYFSGADVHSATPLKPGEWVHVVHTYVRGESRVYVNGVLDGTNKTPDAPLNIKSPARMYIGGWYGDFRFTGDIDEVRLSSVARSPEWVKLQYENQKPLQTAVGPLIQAGSEISVSEKLVSLLEGKSIALTAKAGGAQKIYWIVQRAGRETVESVDCFSYTLNAGRVTGDTNLTVRFKAVFPKGVKTLDVPVTIREDIPDPVFKLRVPARWDGRRPIEVVADVTNLRALQAKDAGVLKTEWSAGPFAVIKEAAPGKLILTRSQNSGILTVTATMSNGGNLVSQTVKITVTEPAADRWILRSPEPNEEPQEGQFYARDDRNEGTLYCNGTLADFAESLCLKVYANNTLFSFHALKPAADRSYAFTVKLKPGLIKYRVKLSSTTSGREVILHSAGNIVCGDAYIIDGQSNALATDTREKSPAVTNEWVRSYGQPTGTAKENSRNLWCNPVWKAQNGEKAELGWWGMELAKRLVESQKIPVFIINAAVGGTRIDQHQRSAANHVDLDTIYGRMLWRVRQAKLTHGIRGIIWHQGENDQGADGPTGGFGWETYQPLFIEMTAAWKQDFPNVKNYYVFQIWPNSCAMGGRNGSGDRLREKQRTLPFLFSNMSIMSTLGIRPEGGCHFPLVGWAEFARLIQPLIERDHYGRKPDGAISAPNLLSVKFAGADRSSITLEFDQPVVWEDKLVGQFYLDGDKDKVASGSVVGKTLVLKLKEPGSATKITYLKEINWSQDKLLMGENGIAALTFCEVPIGE